MRVWLKEVSRSAFPFRQKSESTRVLITFLNADLLYSLAVYVVATTELFVSTVSKSAEGAFVNTPAK